MEDGELEARRQCQRHHQAVGEGGEAMPRQDQRQRCQEQQDLEIVVVDAVGRELERLAAATVTATNSGRIVGVNPTAVISLP